MANLNVPVERSLIQSLRLDVIDVFVMVENGVVSGVIAQQVNALVKILVPTVKRHYVERVVQDIERDILGHQKKNPGPDGKATLCGTCGSRYRAGHTGPPKKKDGKFECDDCGKLLDTVGALGSHRRFCDGGKWRCKWCQCTANECIGKNPGPDGKATLCQTCGARYRSGHSGPPKRIDGKYLCELCGKLLDSLVALGGHKRFCPGGSAWRCDWCNQFTEFKNRSSGPLGDNKLCISCHDDWKRFHFDAPPLIITSGQFICELCGAHLLDIASLILHRTNQCDQTLKSKLYEDSAEWLGSSRAAILGPAAKNNALPQNAIGGIGKPRDDTSKYKSENDVTWPTNMKRLRPITNGLSLGERALEFWDTARHLARRLDGGPLHGLVPEDFLRQRGQWWLKLTPGMLAYNDGWDWIAYERGLTSVNGVSPAFHGLNAVLTRALLRYRGDGVWQSVTAHNWLTLLCNTFSNDPLADFVRTAQARVKENREKARNNTTQPNGTSPSFTKSAPSSTELTSVLKPAERLEFISHFGNLLMSHAIMYQHVDYSTSLLVKLAALKREAWQHRQRAARHTETCLNRPEPLIAEIQNGNARINKRIRVRLGPAPPLFNTIDNNDEHIEAARTRRLEEQLAAHRLELDCQFAGLRALAPSYRRRPLGIDRRGRAYFLLGDVWEALFVRCPCVKADNKKKAPPPGRDLWGDTVTTVDESEIRARQPAANWFMLEPSQAAALRESLCPEQEAQLAAALDEILPGLLATQGMSDPTYILSGGAPAQDKENIQCAVCGEATSNHDDKGTLDDVLLCDHCDAEVHFACSGLQKMPKDDEPFQCPACAASSTDYLPLLSNRVETDDDCPPTTP
eukprot:CAMPEP_0197362548 /NCGR_PEP_ID=MMETSP0893-20130614/64078_1 /TAXON_ID=44058 ORGANISM="Aureoumbra lagunensis, Strain CCMP1510" /NCGR_SAMPLE_ID=MMETSP0893 /ASSEMBLY_ACC=CAM_ASM_000539 /LENGTH=854 /DNA_ID=CAMNT_0042884365 /DNA_START=185 /DNA_END=2749 /DNA_ORIENTATION=-